ncbi:uncharacterized protein J4E78_006326 [Alternaria triticimaculans]|uniref:uncharacterized protein n=1 Tax=Alternaria triticimaculans TaxID=297637 RepID=UPI0020C289EE|nr:uncharacterized protein J4E78_006326 [Alternaria triticimaculans]KAI4657937.1 hypothetical protein J4E78_006326 [Alternaria triticimaculans]
MESIIKSPQASYIMTTPSSAASPGDTLQDTSDVQSTLAATNDDSIFGSGCYNGESLEFHDEPLDLQNKRKITDPDLEIVTIDRQYDLTLIVGSPEHVGGQKAYQVNKGVFRHASKAWDAMMSGNWAESDMSEIAFPEDSAYAFHIVLRIAHWQLQELPETLSQQELVQIAILSDKYDLERLLHAAAELKNWIQQHKDGGVSWPSDIDLQDFTMITAAFGLTADYEYLINKLAMEISVDKDKRYCVVHDDKLVHVRADFPTRIQAQAGQIRTTVLQELLQTCKTALHNTFTKDVGKCGSKLCPLTQFGLTIKVLDAAELHPLPDNLSSMHLSVLAYWTYLNNTGIDYDGLLPARCRAAKLNCVGDYGILKEAREIIKRYAHQDLWAGWKAKQYI